jgi:hypothetical protein
MRGLPMTKSTTVAGPYFPERPAAAATGLALEPYPAQVPEQLSRALTEEIRRLLDNHGLSGRELARLTGIPQRTLAKKLSGQHPFDVDDLQAIASVLEHSVSDLMTWAEKH